MPIQSVAIYCRVIDNFGDIGVCWRLARQLAHEYACAVSLIVDDLSAFQKIWPEIDPAQVCQQQQGVQILLWRESDLPDAQLVIEGFGCTLPGAALVQMQARKQQGQKLAWLNLEYLSAESWVESCHALPSPQAGLCKYFFFPGFSDKTGGLLREADLLARRAAFQSDGQAQRAFWQELGVSGGAACKISLFCYPGAPVQALLQALLAQEREILCCIPHGVAGTQVAAFLQQEPSLNAAYVRGQLRLQIMPFLTQAGYDHLLWACDLNFVRGEDSFVRAQWAARPFVWQIYPQEEGAHLEKLEAFLQRYCEGMPEELRAAVQDFWQCWNRQEVEQMGQVGQIGPACRNFLHSLPQLQPHSRDWAQRLAKNEDLACSLLQFAQKIG